MSENTPTTQSEGAAAVTESPTFWAAVALVAGKVLSWLRQLYNYRQSVMDRMRDEVTKNVYREVEARFQYLYQQLEKRREEIDDLRKQNAGQQREIDGLKQEHRKAVEDLAAVREVKESLERELRKLRGDAPPSVQT